MNLKECSNIGMTESAYIYFIIEEQKTYYGNDSISAYIIFSEGYFHFDFIIHLFE